MWECLVTFKSDRVSENGEELFKVFAAGVVVENVLFSKLTLLHIHDANF